MKVFPLSSSSCSADRDAGRRVQTEELARSAHTHTHQNTQREQGRGKQGHGVSVCVQSFGYHERFSRIKASHISYFVYMQWRLVGHYDVRGLYRHLQVMFVTTF